MAYDLEPTSKLVTPAPAITFRAVYKRRGSDFIFSSTADGSVLVSRYSYMGKRAKHYLHSMKDMEPHLADIKNQLVEGGYKLVEAIQATIPCQE